MRTARNTAMGLLALGLALAANLAQAQMFGNRQLRQPLSRQQRPGFNQDQQDVGSLQGNERFLRANRRATDFVGPDLRELQRFIGALQANAQGSAASAMTGLRRRVDRSASMNRPLTPAPKGQIYHPRLAVGFTSSAMNPRRVEAEALDVLARSPRMSAASRIAVLVEGRTAILRGEVPSARDRDLAAILLSFEPGISTIQNELAVNPRLRPSADSLGARRARETQREAWPTMSHARSVAAQRRVWKETTSGSR